MAIVFDLDGTLIDSLPDITQAANGVLAAFSLPPLPQSRVAGFVGLGEQVFVDRLIAASGLDPQARNEIMAVFLQLYANVADQTRLFDGVAQVLLDFQAQGVPMGLCTNKPSGPLAPVLDTPGLKGMFACVVAGDTLAVRKPDPAPLHHCFQKLGMQSGVYVGDSETDAETAKRAGVPFALFTRGIRVSPIDEIPHDIAFDDFAQLPAIYAKLTA